jgi:hypothetical protein
MPDSWSIPGFPFALMLFLAPTFEQNFPASAILRNVGRPPIFTGQPHLTAKKKGCEIRIHSRGSQAKIDSLCREKRPLVQFMHEGGRRSWAVFGGGDVRGGAASEELEGQTE